MKNGEQGAFACPDNGNEYTTTWQGQVGLTKREYFAGLAMQGMLSNSRMEGSTVDLAKAAVKVSDEILKQLEDND